MPGRRRLRILDDLFVALSTKAGDGGFQHVLLLGHMRQVAIQAIRYSGLVRESRICQARAHILVTFKTHLSTGHAQHPGNIPAMRIVAGNTSSGGERSMRDAALKLIFFVAL
jgi:hypothetical protein